MKFSKRKLVIVTVIIIIILAITVFAFFIANNGKKTQPNTGTSTEGTNNVLENNTKEPKDPIDDNPQNSVSTQ